MKKLAFVFLMLIAKSLYSQTPTQIKQIIPSTTTVNLAWDFNVTDEVNIDSFVIQRTAFANTTTITSPYSVEQVITQKTARQVTYTLPTGLTAGQKGFFRMVSRKVGLADSAPSNVIEVDVLATPPSPTNFRFP